MNERRLSFTSSMWLLDRGKPVKPPSSREAIREFDLDPEVFYDAFESLPDHEREVLTAFYWERVTYQELSDRFQLKGRQYALYEVKKAQRLLRRKLDEVI